jgi:hypothetical protein
MPKFHHYIDAVLPLNFVLEKQEYAARVQA